MTKELNCLDVNIINLLTTYIISPHPLLQLYVDGYMLCTTNGGKVAIKGTWAASNETTIIFHLADQPVHYIADGVVSALQNKYGCVAGLLSHTNGTVSFDGIYHTFMIQFKANGFNKLFHLPAAAFVNHIFYIEEVIGKRATTVNEALQQAGNIQEMADIADKFLLNFLSLQKSYTSPYTGITLVSNALFSNAPLLSIEQYAYKANMSVRNFGRRFTEQVGVSPKFYCRLMRFNNAINKKLKNPCTNLTSVAHECGYYDQMHMIKDFKEFANSNPFLYFNDFPAQLTEEKFIKIKRTAF